MRALSITILAGLLAACPGMAKVLEGLDASSEPVPVGIDEGRYRPHVPRPPGASPRGASPEAGASDSDPGSEPALEADPGSEPERSAPPRPRPQAMIDLQELLEGRGPGADEEAPASEPPHRAALRAKLEAEEPLTLDEFLLYVRLLEASQENRERIASAAEVTRGETLPARGWALIITKMHASRYSSDRHVSFGPVDLFKNGSENLGWEEIQLPTPKAPKFVYAADGERVDIAHAYAGVAALVMRRNRIWGNITASANTQAGDALQVAGDALGGLKDTALGILDRDRREAGLERLSNPGRYLPPDQRHGNFIGYKAHDYLQKNRGAHLSVALGHGIDTWRAGRARE